MAFYFYYVQFCNRTFVLVAPSYMMYTEFIIAQVTKQRFLSISFIGKNCGEKFTSRRGKLPLSQNFTNAFLYQAKFLSLFSNVIIRDQVFQSRSILNLTTSGDGMDRRDISFDIEMYIIMHISLFNLYVNVKSKKKKFPVLLSFNSNFVFDSRFSYLA